MTAVRFLKYLDLFILYASFMLWRFCFYSAEKVVFSVQENYEFLSRCIKENLGFNNGKPLAACIIYKCLVHWQAFDSERTAIFDYIIEGINEVLKVIHWLCLFKHSYAIKNHIPFCCN